ncbi:MAG: methionyl-tRNA formyltransferase [Gemmatimonadaceae bacterium]
MKHPKLPIERRVGVVGCKHTTRDFITGLAREGVQIDHCVTITPEKGTEQKVAGYYDLRPFLDGRRIPFTTATKYSLKSDEDRIALLELRLDVVLVMGWQRLLPDWWLESLSIGAFGMHGSFKPLPHGRGRSPMNWSLLQGRTLFFTHLFQYLPGVDDGPVIGMQLFDLTPFDTAHTSHHKNMLASIRLAAAHLPALMDASAVRTAQPHEGASFWPKRTDEDGLIYWSDTTTDIYNLVRAITAPFPGAFGFLDDDPARRIRIWRAIPFDTHIVWPAARPGEIVNVFYDGTFIVKTGDTSLLVLESEGHPFDESDVGRRLGDLGRPRTVWSDLPS